MRIGLLEIGTIIIVISLGALLVRFLRVNPNTTKKEKESPNRRFEERSGKAHRKLSLIGISAILIGIFLLLSGISLFKWMVWSYLWSFIILALGFLIVFLSRKR